MQGQMTLSEGDVTYLLQPRTMLSACVELPHMRPRIVKEEMKHDYFSQSSSKRMRIQ